jgi:acyl carrier protein
MTTLEKQSKSEVILETILEMLGPSAAQLRTPDGGVDVSTRLLEVGLVDSKGLLDIILKVEGRCGVEFNPEGMDVEKGVTLGSLLRSYGEMDSDQRSGRVGLRNHPLWR